MGDGIVFIVVPRAERLSRAERANSDPGVIRRLIGGEDGRISYLAAREEVDQGDLERSFGTKTGSTCEQQ